MTNLWQVILSEMFGRLFEDRRLKQAVLSKQEKAFYPKDGKI